MASNKGITEAFNPDNCKVRDLRKFLRDHGEFISGNKTEFIERAKGAIAIGAKPLKEVLRSDEENGHNRSVDKLITPLPSKTHGISLFFLIPSLDPVVRTLG